jgi:hypothetical protein
MNASTTPPVFRQNPVIPANGPDKRSGFAGCRTWIFLTATMCLFQLVWLAVYAWYQTDWLMLLSIPVNIGYVIIWVGSLMCVFIRWKHSRFFAFLPLAICLTTDYFGSVISPRLMIAGFESILPRYAAVVDRVERGNVAFPKAEEHVDLSAGNEGLGYVVWADKSSNGVLTVTFIVGGSFPVKHWGYLYSSSGEIIPGSNEDRNWPKRRKLRDKWFWIAD